MYQQQKFARAARRRRYLAIAVSVLFHLAIFAAISSDQSFVEEVVPDFIKELFDKNEDVPRA
ncbi:MAG: hypothetical protein AAFZ15_03590 [Bacteroidota bacterium]